MTTLIIGEATLPKNGRQARKGAIGSREIKKPEGVALKHVKSDTLFVFRPYEDSEHMQTAEIDHVRFLLDQRGLLKPESFAALLTKAPA